MTKIKNIAAALSAIVLFATTSFAGTPGYNPPAVKTNEATAEPLSVSYLGADENYNYFKVSVRSGSNKVVSFSVSDREEGELYSSFFSTDKEQTLKIEKRDNQQLDFSLRAGNEIYSRSFTVLPTVTLVKL